MKQSRRDVQVRLPVELIEYLKFFINAEGAITAEGEQSFHLENPILKEDEPYTTILKVFLLANLSHFIRDPQKMKQLIRRTGGVSEVDVDRAAKRLRPESQVLVPGGLLKAIYDQQTEYLQQVREDLKRQKDLILEGQGKDNAQRALIYQGVLGSLVNYPSNALKEAYERGGGSADDLVRQQIQAYGLDSQAVSFEEVDALFSGEVGKEEPVEAEPVSPVEEEEEETDDGDDEVIAQSVDDFLRDGISPLD